MSDVQFNFRRAESGWSLGTRLRYLLAWYETNRFEYSVVMFATGAAMLDLF